jgi:hypothetical protein
MFEVQGIFSYACNGAPGINGSAGEPGTTGQDATTVAGTETLKSDYPWADIPGLAKVVSVPDMSKVFISADGGAVTLSSSLNGLSVIEVGLLVDGVLVATRRVSMVSTAQLLGAMANWSVSLSTELPAGNHEVKLQARVVAGGLANVSGPAQSPHQGHLTVMVLKR